MSTKAREYQWPVPAERVYFYTIDRPFSDPAKYLVGIPRIKSVSVLKDDGDFKKRYIKSEYHASAEIPSALRNIVKPNMLGWIQEQWWDGSTKVLKVKVTPHFLANLTKISNEITLTDKGDGSCVEKISMIVDSAIPILGKVLEQAILSQTYDSLDQMRKQDIAEAREKG